MQIVRLGSVLFSLSVALGCGGSAVDGGGASGMAGSAGRSGVDGAGQAGASNGEEAGNGGEAGSGGEAGVFVATPIWNADSERFELHCSGFVPGSLTVRADREQLSARQLQVLGDLTTAPRNNDCQLDGIDCEMAITDRAGAVARYRANDDDCQGGKDGLAFASVEALRKELGCEYRDAFNPRIELLRSNPLCGYALQTVPEVNRQKLALSEPGRRYHIELSDCGSHPEELTAQVLGTDPTTPLASGLGSERDGAACLALELQVSEPTEAELVVTAGAHPSPYALELRFW